jgi:hypothetical protein
VLGTADTLVRIADRFGHQLKATSSSDAIQIDFDALRALASPSVPEPVAKEAVERAKKGEPLTKAVAKTIVEKAKSSPSSAPKKLEKPQVVSAPIKTPEAEPKKPSVEAIVIQDCIWGLCKLELTIVDKIAREEAVSIDECREAIRSIEAVIQALEEIATQ